MRNWCGKTNAPSTYWLESTLQLRSWKRRFAGLKGRGLGSTPEQGKCVRWPFAFSSDAPTASPTYWKKRWKRLGFERLAKIQPQNARRASTVGSRSSIKPGLIPGMRPSPATPPNLPTAPVLMAKAEQYERPSLAVGLLLQRTGPGCHRFGRWSRSVDVAPSPFNKQMASYRIRPVRIMPSSRLHETAHSRLGTG